MRWDSVVHGQVLQVACVYGNLTEHIVRRLGPKAHLNVVDVAPVQIKNLHQKLSDKRQVSILQQDASQLSFDNASHDAVLVFFLLHEMPLEVRRKTIAEALAGDQAGWQTDFCGLPQAGGQQPVSLHHGANPQHA
jgi:ubiquinone/menaquinone biosynthesis C-methylase UbiE